jgi:hypothetical protein
MSITVPDGMINLNCAFEIKLRLHHAVRSDSDLFGQGAHLQKEEEHALITVNGMRASTAKSSLLHADHPRRFWTNP